MAWRMTTTGRMTWQPETPAELAAHRRNVSHTTWWVLGAAGLALIAILIGNAVNSSVQRERRAAAPHFEIAAARMAADYAENGLAAETKYRDKLVQVCGRVQTVSVGGDVWFDVGALTPVIATACPGSSALRRGDWATIRGYFGGLQSRGIVLTECILATYSAPP